MKRIYLAFIFTIICSLQASAQSQILGADMPKAIFYKTDGHKFYTAQIPKNSKSLLMLFDATCDHCQKVASNLSKRSKELAKVNVYLISQDELRSITYFMNNFGKALQQNTNVIVLQDRDHVFIPLFNPKKYPALYLYDKNKKLIFQSSNENDVPKLFDLVKAAN